MSVKILQRYMLLCRFFGWAPTWDGLKFYASGVQAQAFGGIRKL